MKRQGKQYICKIIIASFIVFFIIFLTFCLLFFHRRDQFKIYVNSINESASYHYNVIDHYSNYKELLNVPQNGEYYIFGESSDNSSYRVCKNNFINQDILLFGNDFNDVNLYWAMKIINGNIEEVWSATFPLDEKELHVYSYKEQMKEFNFIKSFNNTKVVGYCDVSGYNSKNMQKSEE